MGVSRVEIKGYEESVGGAPTESLSEHLTSESRLGWLRSEQCGCQFVSDRETSKKKAPWYGNELDMFQEQ